MPQSKKRKKKTNGALKHQQMIKNQEKEFWQRVINITKIIGAYSAFCKIPKSDRILIEMMKPSAFRVEGAEKDTLSKSDLKELRNFVTAHLKFKKFEIEKGGAAISLYDYYSAGLSLKHYIRTLNDFAFPEVAELKKAFVSFMKAVSEDYVPQYHLIEYAKLLSWKISTVNQGFYWFQYEVVCDGTSLGYDCFKVHRFNAETMHFVIDGIKRPAFRVGIPFETAEVSWAKIKAENLCFDSSFGELALDVYIQSHALVRLKERLDPMDIPAIHFHLFVSILLPKVAGNYRGKLLIEYRLGDLKLGYLQAIVCEGVVLIKTFLFITNDGTPEGEKLKELAGLGREGKKYFNIDKLNTFINSDIKTNEKLKSMFVEAGCGSLFEFEKHLRIKPEEKKAADAILKYLNVE